MDVHIGQMLFSLIPFVALCEMTQQEQFFNNNIDSGEDFDDRDFVDLYTSVKKMTNQICDHFCTGRMEGVTEHHSNIMMNNCYFMKDLPPEVDNLPLSV